MNATTEKNILVVDDSIEIRGVVRSVLHSKGYQTLEAENGMEALNAVLTEKIDLVISDIKMPKMNGYTLLKELKSNPETQGIPILMLTTEAEPSEEELQHPCAQAWLQKPFQAAALLSAVKRLI